MDDLIAQFGEVVERHRAWAGPLLGLITFGESLAFVGALFPATALMVVAGGLAAAGVLDPVSVVLWCVAGAVAGDAVSYWLGRSAGPRAWRHRRMRRWRRSMARARLFFRRYGVASIFLCRFMGPVRAFVPLIAGVTRMKQARFQAANVGSAAVWVPVMLAPGYLAAESAAGITVAQDGHPLWLGLLAAASILAVLAVRWPSRTRAARRRPASTPRKRVRRPASRLGVYRQA